MFLCSIAFAAHILMVGVYGDSGSPVFSQPYSSGCSGHRFGLALWSNALWPCRKTLDCRYLHGLG